MMSDKPPMLKDVHYEQTPERLKMVFPVKRNVPLAILYTVLVLIWLGMMVGGIIYTFQIAFSGERYAFVFTIMLLVMLVILYRFGRYLLRQWAHLVAGREVVFINKDTLIIRRPISIFGNTDAFDMQHVSPLYLSEQGSSPTFDYGYRHFSFGEVLSPESARELVRFLNNRYFPQTVAEFEDDEEGLPA